MKSFGRAALSDFLGDRVVYRRLQPCDPGLPGLDQVAAQAGLPAGTIPRKNEAAYAAVIVQILSVLSRRHAPHHGLDRIIYIGDTRLLDGSAYANLCAVADLPGLAFIGSETNGPVEARLERTDRGAPLYLANRWALLRDFDRYCAAVGLPVDEGTAVIIDLDKTALGARGRNAQAIDAARIEAVQDTVAGILGPVFDPAAFQAVYEPLNRPEFHPFTGDNQDYLAYICLILGGGLLSFSDLVDAVRSGSLSSFLEFINRIEQRRTELPPQLAEIHADIYRHVQAGDPTPFKEFRRREYFATFRRFGCLEDTEPVGRLLTDEILITQEVRAVALEWLQRGALLFGLSDKPDEAAVPMPEAAAQGYLPLHRAVTHAVGEASF